ncbi:DUF4199 domain-containing protein [uncultured Tenacibaculum sp.]|uniref:DUF4199 domain-containing protein n=1 Tax=uncultured Tenacibaculum sp. TaxID=174713 RepID=UPI00260E258E|nr:DUF4199 domain-containing protein [uncultured Tenacibaculum sp.]
MDNQTNSKSIILNYGLYLGLLGSIIHLILWASGLLLKFNWINTLVWFAGLIAFIIIGIKKYRNSNNDLISWGQGLKIGMGIAMISGVISLVYTLLFTNVIDPGFQELAMQVQQQAWADAGLTEEQIESFTESSKKFQSPGIISALILGMSAFFGFIVSAIVAAIMKKTEENDY